jgi:hypothetical protein
VILEETTPEEIQVGCNNAALLLKETSHCSIQLKDLCVFLQNHVSVRTSVVEVLLGIAKFCDVYLMERVLDDESEVSTK